MKKIMLSLIVYAAACIAVLLIPASEGYNTVGWKLLVGQVYAIPAFIIALLILLYLDRKHTKSSTA
ncbi:hypothetical protein CR205_08170 [Alteribacter lacisalsi]|uniref:DUF4017 domain-containing protein n=1 Tax=Alteribacter lacisalsi TaxID=2045244 RepID=A0A2W0HNV0_9BACI|nr:DUF4017 family protein [Alteribacter lacisalsi]PYZ98549.1 hypothetical protein CR205_08170 [Alteribacter lacisalsi]